MCAYFFLLKHADFFVLGLHYRMKIKLEFGGGLELLFDNIKSQIIELPKECLQLKDLIDWIAINLLKERHELFIQDGRIRPGILVLINDSDWELEGEDGYVLKENDEIVLISTLHGG